MVRQFTSLIVAAALLNSGPHLPASAQESARHPTADNGPISYLPGISGDYFALNSNTVGRRFHVFVKLPESYSKRPEQRYPVSYLLDGDSLFPMLAPQHLFLTYDEDVPEAIVVGIAYGGFEPNVNMRHIDFRPVLDDGKPGGAANFLRMLEEELLPRIDRAYRTEPSRRTLFGQSRGGSFVLFAANERPSLFSGYIASNPSAEPNRRLYGVAQPTVAEKSNSVVVVTTGTRDRGRDYAQEWGRLVAQRKDLPWRAELVTVEGGTHAASVGRAYRAGMLRVFNLPDEH